MKAKKNSIYLLAAMIVSLTACQQTEEKANEDLYEMKDWKKIAEESKLHSPQTEPRTFVREQLEPEAVATVKDDSLLPEDPVTMKVKNQPLAVVVRSLAKIGKQNILIDDTVKSMITLDVENVPWKIVFKGILETNSLNYVREGNVIRIVSSASVERELKLENLRKQLAQAKKEAVKAQVMRIRTIKLHHLDIDKTAEMVSDLLDIKQQRTSSKGSGKDDDKAAVVVDRDKNTLVVKAVPEDINKILELIETLDRPATQVLIEARIVMTTNRAARELGFQWGGVMKHHHKWMYPGVNSTGVLEGTLDDGINPTSGLFSNFPSSSLGESTDNGFNEGNIVGSNGLSLGLGYADGNMILSAQLTALEEDGKAQVLSSPSITTLDNITAYVESGTEIPYQSDSENTGTTTEFKKAVLRLEVTPHVIDGQLIKMKIFASNDEPDRKFENIDGEPAILTRKAETTVLLMDGETTVIAGLTKEANSKFASGVPWLKDLPYVGKLFRTDFNDKEMSDMLIFITPYVLGKKVVQPAVQQEAPIHDNPGNGYPVEDAPVEDDSMIDETPAEEPVASEEAGGLDKGILVKEIKVGDRPVIVAPVEEAPVEEAPVEEVQE